MEEENQQQVQQEPQQQVTTKEPQQRVTAKDPKKVEAGKRLAAINRKKREAKRREEAQNGGMNQYYGIEAVIAVGVIGGLGYYIYRTKKGGRCASTSTSGEQPSNTQQNNPKPCPQTNKYREIHYNIG